MGLNTVSISVAIEKKSLRLLAHEFGHVKYLVPNISVYLKYFINYSRSIRQTSTHFGHHPGDPSGLNAQAYETKFRGEYFKFVKNKNIRLIIQSPFFNVQKRLTKGSVFLSYRSSQPEVDTQNSFHAICIYYSIARRGR